MSPAVGSVLVDKGGCPVGFLVVKVPECFNSGTILRLEIADLKTVEPL